MNELIFPLEQAQYIEEKLPERQVKVIGNTMYERRFPMSPKHRKRLERQAKRNQK